MIRTSRPIGEPKRLAVISAAACLLGLAFASGLPTRRDQDDAPPTCQDCHAETAAMWQNSLHRGYLQRHLGVAAADCSHCHGDTSAHLADPSEDNIGRFIPKKADNVRQAARLCAGCHKSVVSERNWASTPHPSAGISCFDCHRVHGPDDAYAHLHRSSSGTPKLPAVAGQVDSPTQVVNAACVACHKDVEGQLRARSHHPMLEGRVKCTDCHEVHRSTETALLPAGRDIRDVCTGCHTDRRGPFVFEHEPVHASGLGEGCITCHRPHGSPNPKLAPYFGRALCMQCHTDILEDGAHRSRPGNCWRAGCHAAIHGSNRSEAFLE